MIFTGILYINENKDHDKIILMKEKGYKMIVSPLHDYDFYKDGSKKRPHYHIMIEKEPYLFEKFIDELYNLPLSNIYIIAEKQKKRILENDFLSIYDMNSFQVFNDAEFDKLSCDYDLRGTWFKGILIPSEEIQQNFIKNFSNKNTTGYYEFFREKQLSTYQKSSYEYIFCFNSRLRIRTVRQKMSFLGFTNIEKCTKPEKNSIKSMKKIDYFYSLKMKYHNYWSNAMITIFEQQLKNVLDEIKKWNLTSSVIVRLMKTAIGDIWEPRKNYENIKISTEKDLEKIGVLPEHIEKLWSLMEENILSCLNTKKEVDENISQPLNIKEEEDILNSEAIASELKSKFKNDIVRRIIETRRYVYPDILYSSFNRKPSIQKFINDYPCYVLNLIINNDNVFSWNIGYMKIMGKKENIIGFLKKEFSDAFTNKRSENQDLKFKNCLLLKNRPIFLAFDHHKHLSKKNIDNNNYMIKYSFFCQKKLDYRLILQLAKKYCINIHIKVLNEIDKKQIDFLVKDEEIIRLNISDFSDFYFESDF